MDDINLEDSIEILLGKVPKPVHDYVLNDLSDEVRRLMDKYQLHVDQGGVLQRELLLMLLGQEEPAEFMQDLGKAGISDATIQSLMIDINEEIFKPLRAKEQGRPVERVAPPQPAPPPPPPAPVPEPAPTVPEAITQDMRGMRTMQADMQMAQQQPPWGPQYVAPVYAPPQPYPAYQPVAYMQPQQPQTQTYWVPVTVPIQQPQMQYMPQPVYQQPATPPQPAPPPPPVIETPPAPTPAPVPEPAAWVPPPPPDWQPPPPLPQFESREEPPIKKEFGADPYREPI